MAIVYGAKGYLRHLLVWGLLRGPGLDFRRQLLVLLIPEGLCTHFCRVCLNGWWFPSSNIGSVDFHNIPTWRNFCIPFSLLSAPLYECWMFLRYFGTTSTQNGIEESNKIQPNYSKRMPAQPRYPWVIDIYVSMGHWPPLDIHRFSVAPFSAKRLSTAPTSVSSWFPAFQFACKRGGARNRGTQRMGGGGGEPRNPGPRIIYIYI